MQRHSHNTTPGATQNMGTTVTTWIPSHTGIAGNDKADTLPGNDKADTQAKQGTQEPVVGLHIPTTLPQLTSTGQQQTETSRLQQVRDLSGDSTGDRWLSEAQEGSGGQACPGVPRRCDVVWSRTRHSYP